jgi:hypothetical protein
LADATEAALTNVSTQSDCATLVGNAVQAVRVAQFECSWTGPWKSARDRKTRVRLQGRILDDGYGRWRLVVANRDSDDPLLETEEVLGWTWLRNFDHAAKTMRWESPTIITLQSGSDMLPEAVRINVVTGEVRLEERHPLPRSYPGNPRKAKEPPPLIVRRID